MSVVIPTWNRALTLHRAIDSALAQTLPPIEILVCDDGSTDDSARIISETAAVTVHWLAGPHSGRPAIPRNRGIRQARGEWIAFLDSDDSWLPEKLELQMYALSQTGCLASCTNAWRYAKAQARCRYFENVLPQILRFDDLIKTNLVICSSTLLHRSLFIAARGFPEEENLIAREDYALWLRVATQTGFAYLEEPLIEYKDEPALSIRQQDGSEFDQRKQVLRNFLVWSRSAPVHERFTRKAKTSLRRLALQEVLWKVRRVAAKVRTRRS